MSWGENDAKIIREMIFKENDYMNSRLTWLVTLQGLLFAALGFAWENGREITAVLVITGICAALAAEPPLRFSHQAITELKRKWDKKKPAGYEGPDVIGHLDEASLQDKWKSLISLWYTLPRLFVAAWVSVFLCVLSELGFFAWGWLFLMLPILFVAAWLFGPSCLLCREWFRGRLKSREQYDTLGFPKDKTLE